jgi:Ca2+:H+ antiporter
MQTAGLLKTFVGMILLPLLGNDAHPDWTAVKDRMDICVNVSKCLQTAILIVPAIVLLG